MMESQREPEAEGVERDEIPLPSLRPNFVLLALATSATALLSFVFLAWPAAVASTILASLMIAGADVDARTQLLPNVVTYGGVICGLIAAVLLDPVDAWANLGASILRAAGTALLLGLLREAYRRLRGHEGLGFGDVKLAAAIGAWLPVESIPICFSLATSAALVSLLMARRKEGFDELRLPFGAFLCPALWLIFFFDSLPG